MHGVCCPPLCESWFLDRNRLLIQPLIVVVNYARLLSSAALLGLITSPAMAADDSALKLELSGYARAYVSYINQDEGGGGPPPTKVNSFDMLRDTEIHFTGETTLDSGLIVGAHVETAVDSDDGESDIDESYIYFSGNWGRVNFGLADGAALLLQVAAPSADSNYDGLEQQIQPFNDVAAGLGGSLPGTFNLEYAHEGISDSDKITYLTPVYGGLQVGVSFAPEVSEGSAYANDIEGVREDVTDGYETAVRYEGEVGMVGFAAGAGYTYANIDDPSPGTKDFKEWNVGLDLNIADFGVGAAYLEDNGSADDSDNKTWVVGADYTIGAYKIGASYLNNENDSDDTSADRYTAGVTYSYAPGLSFRGTVSRTEVDAPGGVNADGTALLLGTQVNF